MFESLFPESRLRIVQRSVNRFMADHVLEQDETKAAAEAIERMAGAKERPMCDPSDRDLAFAAVAYARGMKCWPEAVAVVGLEPSCRALLDVVRRGDINAAERILDAHPEAICPTFRTDLEPPLEQVPDRCLPLVQLSRGLVHHNHGHAAPMLRLLLERGADPSARNGIAVRQAIRLDLDELMAIFLDSGVPVDGPAQDGAWLTCALQYEAERSAWLLVERGAAAQHPGRPSQEPGTATLMAHHPPQPQ